MGSDLSAELTKFVQSSKVVGGIKCRTCSLPEPLRKAIEAERIKNGTSVAVLAKYLKSKGHFIPDTTLRRHLNLHLQ